jgi:peptide/nickel transport system substrate-binding protein
MKGKFWIALIISLLCPFLLAFSSQAKNDEVSRRDTLVVVTGLEAKGMDPGFVNDGASDMLLWAVYDQLCDYVPKKREDGRIYAYEVGPRLAKSWESSKDLKTHTFHLVQNARFTNGHRVDAHAVKYSLDRILKQKAGSSWMAEMNGITLNSIKVIDDFTVQITTEKPTQVLPQTLAIAEYGCILDPAVVEAHGGIVPGSINKWLMQNAVGSGPYMLEKWIPGQQIVLKANPNYWRMKPRMKKMIIRPVTEVASREITIKTGEADIAMQLLPKDLARLNALPGVEVIRTPSIETMYVGMNNQKAPWNDINVRKAVACAVPYDQIIKNVLFGEAVRAYSGMNREMQGYDPSFWKYTYDMNKAKEYLAKSGHPKGFKATLDLLTGYPEWETMATILKTNLSKLGIDLNIRKSDRPAWLDIVFKGKGDIFISRYTPYINDPGYFANVWWRCGHRSNHSKWCYPGFDQKIDSMMYELNPEKRVNKCKEMQKIFADEVPWIPLYNPIYAHVQRENLGGYVYYANKLLHYEYFFRK